MPAPPAGEHNGAYPAPKPSAIDKGTYPAPYPSAYYWGLPGPIPRHASGGPIFGRPKMGEKTAGETPVPHLLSKRGR